MNTNTKIFSEPARTRAAIAVTALALLVGGCANMSDTGKGAAIGAGVGALGGYVWSNHMEKKKAEMERATAGTGVSVTQTADNQLRLDIPSDISFDTGRADIRPALRPILDQFASGLRDQPNTEVRIIGHTDSTGSDAINNPLSEQRAASARDYLASRGVDYRRIVTAGRGSREPVADNTSEFGRAKNRRVEIFLAERQG
jgi:outer membrane protein OmpA-like peptidoglycan-associated protein